MKSRWVVLALALAACGKGQAERPPATEVVAREFMALPQSPAPTPELQKQLTFLDTCTVNLIRASDITYETSQDDVDDKVRVFMKQCETELHARLDAQQRSEAKPQAQGDPPVSHRDD